MFLHDIIEDLDLKTLLALSAGKDRNYIKLKEDDWHGEGDAWHGTGNEPRDAWHGTDGAVEEAQTKERNYNDGDRVKLTSEYADYRNPNEVFTVSQCDRERRRCWIGDKQGRGWYAEFEQIMPARSRSVEEGVNFDKLTPQQKAHEYNIDAAQRAMDRRHAEGEDMTGAVIDKKTYEIIKPKQQGVEETEQIDEIFADQGSGSTAKDSAAWEKRRNAVEKMLAKKKHAADGFDDFKWPEGQLEKIVKQLHKISGFKQTHPDIKDQLNVAREVGKYLRRGMGQSQAEVLGIRDYYNIKQGVAEAEGDADGLPHLTKELLQHIVQQVGLEGAHAIVKSLEWGDGAAEELLALILKDLKANISDEEIAEHIGKVKDGYRLYSHKGKNLGTFGSKAGAEKHEREVQYFKHASESLDEDFSDSPVAGAITRRILSQRLDLLKQYGPELVGAAVDNVADFVGEVEEIGSSDVSAWVNQVERMLEENPPEAFAEGVAEAKAPSVIQTIRNNVTGVDQLSRDSEGNLVFRKGFYYTNGNSADTFADRISNKLNELNIPHTIIDRGQVWKPFKGGATIKNQSHWWVKVKVGEQGVAEGEQSHGDKLRATPTERLMAFWNKYKDEPGISPVFGQQLKAIANELARRKQKMELLSLHRDNYINRNNDINEATSNEAVTNAIINRIIGSHVSLLGKYGPEAVTSAAEDVAYHVGEVEEIGSSDVSAWVREVFNQLRDNHG